MPKFRGTRDVWFTLWSGILTEIYYPHVDHPQVRDVEFLFSSGDDLLAEKRDLRHEVIRLEPSQGYGLSPVTPPAGSVASRKSSPIAGGLQF
jgi:hypothetical protein